MMNRLENAARQALEALEHSHANEPIWKTPHRNAAAALREALAEQQAAEPNAVLVEGFGRVAMRKLNDLREKGYAVNGVSIATISEAGETNLGAVTTGGRVLWWPQQPAQQAAEPVDADRARFIIAHLCNTFPELAHCHPARQQQAAEPVAWANPNDLQNFDMKVRTNGGPLHTVPLCLCNPAPTQQPLTDEQIGEIGRNHEKFDKAGNEWFDRWAFARAIEAAHGITSKEGGAA